MKKNMPKEMLNDLLDEVESILNWCEEHPEDKADEYEKRLREFEVKAELKIAPFRVFDGRRWSGCIRNRGLQAVHAAGEWSDR